MRRLAIGLLMILHLLQAIHEYYEIMEAFFDHALTRFAHEDVQLVDESAQLLLQFVPDLRLLGTAAFDLACDGGKGTGKKRHFAFDTGFRLQSRLDVTLL